MATRTTNPRDFPPPWNYLIPLGTKTLIWMVFFGILYLLRHFLPLVFLTFVFAYVAEHGVQGLGHRLESRRTRTTIVFLTLLSILTMGAAFIGPHLRKQTLAFAEQIEPNLVKVDNFIAEKREEFAWMRTVIDKDTKASTVILDLLGVKVESGGPEDKAAGTQEEGRSSEAKHAAMAATRNSAIKAIFSIFKGVFTVTTVFLLSILFAFLIVLDLPRIARGIRSLHDTKLRIFYDEVANTVFRFGQVLGRFLEAQAVIAILNTALTATGMWLLGIKSIAFLAGMVFICSFIPVAGVFISTLPICLEALVTDGFGLVLAVIAMVTIVHMVEAYVLNPIIMGRHLKLNPVVVLMVLVIGHELFGLWGLLLGVPAVTYIFGYAIRGGRAGKASST